MARLARRLAKERFHQRAGDAGTEVEPRLHGLYESHGRGPWRTETSVRSLESGLKGGGNVLIFVVTCEENALCLRSRLAQFENSAQTVHCRMDMSSTATSGSVVEESRTAFLPVGRLCDNINAFPSRRALRPVEPGRDRQQAKREWTCLHLARNQH